MLDLGELELQPFSTLDNSRDGHSCYFSRNSAEMQNLTNLRNSKQRDKKKRACPPPNIIIVMKPLRHNPKLSICTKFNWNNSLWTLRIYDNVKTNLANLN